MRENISPCDYLLFMGGVTVAGGSNKEKLSLRLCSAITLYSLTI